MEVRIDELARSFGPVEAVRGISLEIREGETFGLLGPNGAGKTTTLSMLSTLLAPSSGDAWIFGESLRRNVSRVKRIVGLAPQEISLYTDLTAEENLLFFGRISGVHGRRLRRRVEELLELVGLTPRRGERVRIFSGGMKRRLNLACSLVHAPRLLLLDEPTVGVDPQSRENLFQGIESFASEGTTVLYSTHYMEEAERLCDRIAIMDEGRIAAVGTRDELLEIVGVGEVIEIHGGADAARLRRVAEVVDVESSGDVTRLLVRDAARALGPIGAILARFLVGVAQLWLLFAFGRLAFGMSLGSSLPALFLVTLATVFAMTGFSLVVAALARSREQIIPLGLTVIMVVCSLGGCWWPLYEMPSWLSRISYAFFTPWAMEGIHDVILRDRGLADVAPALGVLTAYGAGSALLGARLYHLEDGRL